MAKKNTASTVKFGFVGQEERVGRKGISLSKVNEATIIKGWLDQTATAKDLYAAAIIRHNAERAAKGLEAQVAPDSYINHPASLLYGMKDRFMARMHKGDKATCEAAQLVGLPGVAKLATTETEAAE